MKINGNLGILGIYIHKALNYDNLFIAVQTR